MDRRLRREQPAPPGNENERISSFGLPEIDGRLTNSHEIPAPPPFSSLSDITIFPPKVHFHTTFPNIAKHQKLVLANGGLTTESFTILLRGNPQFTVSTHTITLEPGSTTSLIVTFTPHITSLYNGTLIFQSANSILVPLTGHCVPSPLEFPPPDHQFWTFTKRATEKVFELKNTSLSLTLSVVLATNISPFEVIPRTVDIPPASETEVRITFSPVLPMSMEPALSIQCSQSGDSIVIPLRVTAPKPVITVDFGFVSVGNKRVEKVVLKKPQIVPTVAWPFSVESAEGPLKEMFFAFSPEEAGHFRNRITVEEVILSLVGVGVDSPYRISVPEGFPSTPIIIRNISDGMVVLQLSVSVGFSISPKQLELRPNQSQNVKINGLAQPGLTIQVEWVTEDGHQVIDEYRPVIATESILTSTRLTEIPADEVTVPKPSLPTELVDLGQKEPGQDTISVSRSSILFSGFPSFSTILRIGCKR
jgi:hypothetical protein